MMIEILIGLDLFVLPQVAARVERSSAENTLLSELHTR